MSSEAERGPRILDAHQELVRHVESSVGRIRNLSVVTMVVAAVFALSYVSQLLLPLYGQSTVTVNLMDPANVVAELVVLVLALLWLYVGFTDLRFSMRMKGEIARARAEEKQIQDRLS